jgi:hypothetical protein
MLANDDDSHFIAVQQDKTSQKYQVPITSFVCLDELRQLLENLFLERA